MRAGRATSGAAYLAVIGALLVLAPTPPVSGSSVVVRHPSSARLRPLENAASLEVDPPAWQMTGDNSTNLSAIWVGPPPGCTLTPLWYHWAIGNTPESGELNSSSGPKVTFVGSAATPGVSDIVVEGAGVVECPGGDYPLVSNASATVSVVAELELANISVMPGPLEPGQPASLSASVSGGEPPYAIGVDWGDGTTSAITRSVPGEFTSAHVYESAGQFAPSLTATDAQGRIVHSVDPTTVEVDPGAAISISVDRATTDVGLPVVWNATIARALPWFETYPECDGLPQIPLEQLNGTVGTCTFSVPGRATVAVGLGPVYEWGVPVASATVSVVPGPSVTIAPPGGPAEAGVSSVLMADVVGGVPPLTLRCTGSGPVTPSQLELPADGPVAVPVYPDGPGQLEFTLQVTDSEGASSPPVSVTLFVDPTLNGSFDGGQTLDATGANVSLVGFVVGGVGPFVWSIVPSAPGAGPSEASGTLADPGEFEWSAVYRLEGSVVVRALVEDSAGQVLETTSALPAISPVTLGTTVVATGTRTPGSFTLEVGIAAGLPPFNLTAESAAGPLGSRSVSADGTILWTLNASATGSVLVTIAVQDSAGGEAWSNATVPIPSLPSAAPLPPPEPLAWVIAAVGVLAMVVAVALVWGRRKRTAPPPPSVDPTSVLRSILAPADGAERNAVELLAEQEGVPLGVARTTLDRLIAEHAVRSEIDGDGIEVLSWVQEPAP
jgi:hypothetical protein